MWKCLKEYQDWAILNGVLLEPVVSLHDHQVEKKKLIKQTSPGWGKKWRRPAADSGKSACKKNEDIRTKAKNLVLASLLPGQYGFKKLGQPYTLLGKLESVTPVYFVSCAKSQRKQWLWKHSWKFKMSKNSSIPKDNLKSKLQRGVFPMQGGYISYLEEE